MIKYLKGCMKLVGETFKNDRFYKDSNEKIVVIGISCWVHLFI